MNRVSAVQLSLMQVLRRHLLLAGLVVIYGLIAKWLSQYHDVSIHEEKAGGLFNSFLVNVPIMVFFVLLFRLLQLTYVERDPDRIGTMKAEVLAFVGDRTRMIAGIVSVLLMAGTLVAFAQLKNLIPVLQPYVWDEYFMQLDKTLHFGQHPYQLLHALLGWEHIITFFTGIYNFWLFMMYFVLLGACFMRPDSLLRMQFLIAFLLTWAIGGNLVATAFSSAGPVYYSNLGLGDTYAGLMSMLESHAASAPITVIDTQNLLWSWHTQDQALNGISAFPSMHVASSVLMAIFLRRVSRVLGLCATIFAVGIMFGSVLLAWHYAVDGYAGAVIAVAAWIAAGWLVRLVYGERPAHLIERQA
ncbi:MAG: phosphatase PAP2 family protein [Tabrizicola sp.]|nr:phosphatase PAP2 family protein [Tabrizicola sp.]